MRLSDTMLEEVAVLCSMAEKTTVILSGMPGKATKDTSRLADTVGKLIEQEKKIDGEIDRLVDLRTEIYAAIQQVADRDARRVLHLRYMGYRSWPAIAEEMKPMQRHYERFTRGYRQHERYGSVWRKIRDRHLARESLCEMCRAHGRFVAATLVQHIKPLGDGDTHDESNLMSLCVSCHERVHQRSRER